MCRGSASLGMSPSSPLWISTKTWIWWCGWCRIGCHAASRSVIFVSTSPPFCNYAVRFPSLFCYQKLWDAIFENKSNKTQIRSSCSSIAGDGARNKRLGIKRPSVRSFTTLWRGDPILGQASLAPLGCGLVPWRKPRTWCAV